MAEEAVALGSRIIIAATLASTLGPTRELVLDAAREVGKAVQIVEVVCETAWDKFERGDKEGSLSGDCGDPSECSISRGCYRPGSGLYGRSG